MGPGNGAHFNMKNVLRVGIEIRGTKYRLFNVFQNDNDASIYLKLFSTRPDSGLSGQLKIPFPGTLQIAFNESTKPVKVDHTSVHESGVSLVKSVDGEYSSRLEGPGLKGLNTLRHLWTIVPGTLDSLPTFKSLKDKSLVLKEEDPTLASRAMILFAAPKGNLNLNIPFVLKDEHKSPLPKICIVPVDFFNEFNLLILTYSTEHFVSAPPRTYKFQVHGAMVPFVEAITDRHIELGLRPVVASNN